MKAIEINFDVIGRELYEPKIMRKIETRQADQRRMTKLSMNEGQDKHAAIALRGYFRMSNRSVSPLKSLDAIGR